MQHNLESKLCLFVLVRPKLAIAPRGHPLGISHPSHRDAVPCSLLSAQWVFLRRRGEQHEQAILSIAW